MVKQKNTGTILFSGLLLLLALAFAGAARAADPPDAGGALWTPFAPGCAVSVADELPGVSMAFAWTGAEYEKADTLQPGYGYFLIAENPGADLQLPDCRLDLLSAQSVSITLHAGWNLLGNPFSESMTFDAVADASGARAQAFAARAVARSARAIISQGGQAGPGDVVWVYSSQQGVRNLGDLVDAALIKKIQLIAAREHGNTSNAFYIPGKVSLSVSVTYDDSRVETLDPARVQWSVSDENVGRFDEPGVLTSVAPGTVTVTAALANGMSASTDVQLVVECEKVCISAVVPEDKYATVEAYEQFAETLRTQHMGIMPTPKSDCAYMEVSGKKDIKPVKQATLSLIENITSVNANVRAYCRQNFDSGAAAHVLFEADPLGGADRKVWLKNITAETEWAWDKQDVIKGITTAGVIQAGAFGYANLTATYRTMQASPAFVGVDHDTPTRITAYQNREAAGYSSWLPVPWKMVTCQNLAAGICKAGEKQSTTLGVLPLGQSAPLYAMVSYGSGRLDKKPEGVTWTAEPEGVVSLSEDGAITGLAVGRAAVRAHLGDLSSTPLDVVVATETITKLNVFANINYTKSGKSLVLRKAVENDILYVIDFSSLKFDISADTAWSRSLSLNDDDVQWVITDATGNTVHEVDFSGTAPFDITVSYGGKTIPFRIAEEQINPTLKIHTKNVNYSYNSSYYNSPIQYLLTPSNGMLYISQPELLTFSMAAPSMYGYEFDCFKSTQWTMTSPDGKTTQGAPLLDDGPGLYTVTATYNGKSQSVKIEVYDTGVIIMQKSWNYSSDIDSKYESGEGFRIEIYECKLPDWYTRGKKMAPEMQYSEYSYSRDCKLYSARAIDARYDIEITDPDVFVYEGYGMVRAKSAGIASLRAVNDNGMTSNALQDEVWEPSDDFRMCAGVPANQAVWYDPRTTWTTNKVEQKPQSRAIIQTDCNRYRRGEKVKVRWFGQIAPGVSRHRVNVCLDLYIKDCKGKIVKTFRSEGCSRFAARAATDFSDYTTVFDTVEEWDQTADNGKRVASGCYMASSTFNILYEPVVEVRFMID